MAELSLLTSEVAARTKQLEFLARTRVEAYLKGANRSKLKGSSTDFMQHKQYVPGDDLRDVDWRVYARSERLVTRQYEEYTNLNVLVVIDHSGSMNYQGNGTSKVDYVRGCAAMLCYLLNSQRDNFGVAHMSDHVVQFLKPAGGRKQLVAAMQQLVSAQVGGETDFAACVRQLSSQIRRKSVFVFFSDCFQDPAQLTKSIGQLQIQGHDVVLYQVIDPDELDLKFSGFTQFLDLETGTIDAADPLEIKQAYHEVVKQHQRNLNDGCNRYGIEFHSLITSPDWDQVLAQLLRKRAARL